MIEAVPTGGAQCASEATVHMEHIRRHRLLVQIIDVLRDDRHRVGEDGLQSGQCPVRGIRVYVVKLRPPRIIEAVNQLGITCETGSSDIRWG